MNYLTKYDNETQFETDFVRFLEERCGWKGGIINYPTEQDLVDNWADILYNNNRDIDRLGNYPLTKGEMKQILDQIKRHRTPFNLSSFINGKSILITRDNKEDKIHFGKSVSLKIYDRQEVAGGKSIYQIVRQPKFDVKDDIKPQRRGDVMLLINGMPLFHIELKKSGIPISQATNQIEKYSREGAFSGIFSLVQIFIAMTPENALYFTNPGPDGIFNEDFFFHWADSDNVPIIQWQTFASELLHIPMAHELIGFYTVPDKKDGIFKVLRSYQYYAVVAIANRVQKRAEHWLEKGFQRGGYIWHTTGSGKTLTSFLTANLISKSNDADKVIFLVDRIELDTQSVKHYKAFAEDENSINEVRSTDILVSKLISNEEDDTLIVASIQKMSRITDDHTKRRQNDIEKINKKRIIFIVDECHRDTFGEMMNKIKETYPYAMFFGFTGTPIQEENKKKGCTSADVFGDELPGTRYTIGDGIRDKNVLGFDPYKVSTFTDMDVKKQVALNIVHATSEAELLTDPKKSVSYYEIVKTIKMAGSYDNVGNYIKGAEDYLPTEQYTFDPKQNSVAHGKAVVANILENYNVISNGKKFHSIFATSSIPEAIAYYHYIKSVNPNLKTTVLVDPSDNNDKTNYDKIEGLAEVINDYNKRFNTQYKIATYADMKRDIALRLSHEEPYIGKAFTSDKQLDMLIVVNQMLTGFDSKWVNALYLDKVMRQENIIQAFSRTNRIFGPDKPFGIIYYYRKPHTMERYIYEAIKLYSGNEAYKVYVDKLEKNLKKFNNCYNSIKELFANEKIIDFSHLPIDVSARAKFAKEFNLLNATLEMIKVQGFSWKQSQYKDILVEITEPIYFTLLQRYKELAKPSQQCVGGFAYDINTHISEISTGKIDTDYMNSRFDRFMHLKNDKASEQIIENAKTDLYKSFAILPEEEQEFAKIIIHDIQLGTFTPKDGYTFKDYIAEYMCTQKDNQINQFATLFGLDANMLKEMLSLNLQSDTIDEFGRFGKLSATANSEKIENFFKQKYSITSKFEIRQKFKDLLYEFILDGGFDISEIQ